MDFFDYWKPFWKLHDTETFEPTQGFLYLYLLEVCNKADWKNPFRKNSSKIMADLNISRSTLIKSRNRLKEAGLIDFKTINGSANTTYELLDLYKFYTGKHTATNTATNTGSNTGTHTGANTLNKTKNKTKNKTNIEVKNDVSSFDIFWDLYDKKVDRVKVENKWDKLKTDVKNLIIQKLPAYIKSTPEKKYRKNPFTYLNSNSWENEMVVDSVAQISHPETILSRADQGAKKRKEREERLKQQQNEN